MVRNADQNKTVLATLKCTPVNLRETYVEIRTHKLNGHLM